MPGKRRSKRTTKPSTAAAEPGHRRQKRCDWWGIAFVLAGLAATAAYAQSHPFIPLAEASKEAMINLVASLPEGCELFEVETYSALVTWLLFNSPAGSVVVGLSTFLGLYCLRHKQWILVGMAALSLLASLLIDPAPKYTSYWSSCADSGLTMHLDFGLGQLDVPLNKD